MKYVVQLSESERNDLQRLVGLPLRHVHDNRWDATAQIGDYLLTVQPDEVYTPDSAHPKGDAVRPSLTLQHATADASLPTIGVITSIRVSSTFFTLSPPVQCPPEQLTPTVTLPASIGYGPVFISATEAAQIADASPDAAVVHLDVAITFHTDTGHSACFFTDGVGFFVHVALDTEPTCEWSSRVTHYELHDRNA